MARVTLSGGDMVWVAVGDVLGQAVGVALSPAAIIAIVLVLFSDRAKVNSAVFLAGWLIGAVALFLVVALVADAADVSDSDSGASTGQGVLQLALGSAFLAVAARTWRHRPRPGKPAAPNKMLEKVATMGPALSFALALLMTALNPKNIALTVSAAGEAASVGLSTSEIVVVAVVFAIVSMLGVGIPVALSVVLGDRATAILTELRDWMTTHSSAIMFVLMLVIGAKMIGTGISTLG
jgi:Sap, sulfolipid-1-addressing protein